MTATTPRSGGQEPPGRHGAIALAQHRGARLGGRLTGRIPGVDLARALAIIGMIAVHVGPTNGTDVAGRLYGAPYGRASLLFVLVAGIGVTLLARSRSTDLKRARVTLLWRAALLLPAGLVLQQLNHGVNVILQAYAALFLIAVVAVNLSNRSLLWLAGLSSVGGPLAFWWGQARAPAVYDRTNGDLAASLPDLLHSLVLSGPYPVAVWVVPLLFGIWLGRRDLSGRRLQGRLVVVGLIVAVLSIAVAEVLTDIAGGAADDQTSPWYLVVSVPHSQMALWLIGGVGSAAAVLGVALWGAEVAARATWPLVATGQLALTVYVTHVVALHIAPGVLRVDEVGDALAIVLVSTVVALLAAVAWRSRWRRGPLEAMLRPPSRLTSKV